MDHRCSSTMNFTPMACARAALPCEVDRTFTVDATRSGCLNQSGAECSLNKKLCHQPLSDPIRFLIRARCCRGSLYDSVLLLLVAEPPVAGTPVEDASRQTTRRQNTRRRRPAPDRPSPERPSLKHPSKTPVTEPSWETPSVASSLIFLPSSWLEVLCAVCGVTH